MCILVCNVAYSAQVPINGPADMYTVTVASGDELIITNGGEYLLSKLDAISQSASKIVIDFSIGGGDPSSMATLVADNDFDGELDTRLEKVSTTSILLTNDFLNNLSGDDVEIIQFDNLSLQGSPVITTETENTNYAYNIQGDCLYGIGQCVITRTRSNTDIAVARESAHANTVARIGVANNPKMLLRPMTLVNMHELSGVFDFYDEYFLSVTPEYYNADGLQGIGVHLNSGTKVNGRLALGMGLYVSGAEFKNSVSDFKSVVYGGNLRFLYNIDDLMFLRGVGGISFSNIDCDNVVNGDTTVNNPDAWGVYGGVDFGAKFQFESGLYLSPFINYSADFEKVVDVHDTNSFVRVGGDVGFDYFMDGVKYSYVLRAGVNTNGYFDTNIGVGAWTVSDKIGGTVSFGLVDTDFGWTGKVAANIRLAF